jgi:DeoR/GlpR family transcriptional regulator of sugar metabolism
MTASGVHVDHGFTEWNPEDAAVKQAALHAASRCIVACDASKIGHSAFARVCELKAVELLVVDVGISDEQRVALEGGGLQVCVAPSKVSATADNRLGAGAGGEA